MLQHQIKKSGRREPVCIFIYESIDYKVRKNFFINYNAIESLSTEICHRKTRNTLFKKAAKF